MYLAQRKIRGKTYLFLEKSIRLPNQKIKKISKIVNGKPKNLNQLIKKYNIYFVEKEKEILINFALGNYKWNHPLTKEDILKIETMKMEYKHIIGMLKKKNIGDLFDRFTVNFTYESNAIEGNSLTLKDVAIVIFEDRVIGGKTLREIYETKNSRDAVDLLLHEKIKINHQSIINLHKIIMKNIERLSFHQSMTGGGTNLEKRRGDRASASERACRWSLTSGVSEPFDKEVGYKNLPNIILGSNLKTAPPEKVYGEMEKLIQWYNQNKQKIYPLQLAAIFHGKFERIHPFQDGNGRVGRFLLNAILVNNGYPPLIIRKTQRVSYLHALRAFDQGCNIPLIRFIFDKYKRTYRDFYHVYYKYVVNTTE